MTASGAKNGFLRRWRRTNWSDRALLAEAMLLLALARVAIMLLPFRVVGRIASTGRDAAALEAQAAKALADRVRWAVGAGARRAPFRALCFEQGLAAQIMLRRRGAQSLLYFGAAPDSQKDLVAHVWVRLGEQDVVGGQTAARFAVLAQFPQETRS